MIPLRAIVKSSIALGIVLSSLAVAPRSSGDGQTLQQKLEAKYAITKPTDDKTDIVTAGAVLILQKDKLIMYPTTTQVPPQNIYKDGKLSTGAFGVHDKAQKFGSLIGHPLPSQAQTTTRYFVTGEKFWVTHIDAQGDGVTFTLFTDAIQDVRYYSTLKFVYPHGVTLTSDQVLTMVGEVLKVQEDENANNSGGDTNQQAQQPAAADNQQQAAPAAEQAPAAAPDPPAPPATVEIGQTPDQVTAILGQPEKIINLGVKQIYVYKDLKVTFVKGKVTDAQ
jgi:hypothetical protein